MGHEQILAFSLGSQNVGGRRGFSRTSGCCMGHAVPSGDTQPANLRVWVSGPTHRVVVSVQGPFRGPLVTLSFPLCGWGYLSPTVQPAFSLWPQEMLESSSSGPTWRPGSWWPCLLSWPYFPFLPTGPENVLWKTDLSGLGGAAWQGWAAGQVSSLGWR